MIAFTDGDKNKDNIYYEADKINERDNFAKALGRENKRQDQIEKGIKNNTPDGVSTVYDKESKEAGKHNLEALQREIGYKNVREEGNKPISYIRTDMDKSLIDNGTIEASKVDDAQPMSAYVDTKKSVLDLGLVEKKRYRKHINRRSRRINK